MSEIHISVAAIAALKAASTVLSEVRAALIETTRRVEALRRQR
jgi:hypothetical protein